MKQIKIIGKNYFGYTKKSRTTCRGLIIQEGKLLISYETKTDQYMIPGGGQEDNESLLDCLIREVGEETGYLIKADKPSLIITEYYEDDEYINYYFIGKVVGNCSRNLTKRELEVGMEPRWINIDEIYKIFSTHEQYDEINEMRRGMYYREYTALKEVIKNEK